MGDNRPDNQLRKKSDKKHIIYKIIFFCTARKAVKYIGQNLKGIKGNTERQYYFFHQNVDPFLKNNVS